MSYLKLTSACALALLLVAATDASAGKTRTKSNNSNERVAPEGVVLQDTAVGANACSTGTGTGTWSWAISSVSTMAGGSGSGAAAASYARTADAQADIGAVCDSAQSAIDRINADPVKLDALNAAIEAQDNAAVEMLLTGNGLSKPLVAGAQYHAINTKGTGSNNGRMAQDMPNRISMNVTVARVDGRLSITVSRNKTGHVTLNR
jgi:hypothetical protein